MSLSFEQRVFAKYQLIEWWKKENSGIFFMVG